MTRPPGGIGRARFRVVAALATLGVVAGIGLVGDLSENSPAAAAVAGDFDPGYIISDSQFYDADAMTAIEIRDFLNAKIGTCENGKCLNAVKVPLESRPPRYAADPPYALVCDAITGGDLWAWEVIYRVQAACGISAKVILVTLQKEQGLVTKRAPTDYALMYAMGYGCPDSGGCTSAVAGLGYQLYQGTRQLKTYKLWTGWRFQPGPEYISYHPSGACGGTTVNIRNFATAALYNYTPYQPNAAALGNMYGTGDSCSSYGNRNFWRYYSDWFGSPTGIECVTDPTSDIETYWALLGGAASALGSPVAPGIVAGPKGVTVGNYQGGNIYCAPGIGAVDVFGEVLSKYVALGGPGGPLGAPSRTSEVLVAGGVTGRIQYFQHGMVLTSTVSGTYAVMDGAMRSAWGANGGSAGALGWPTSDVGSVAGVTYQSFQRGVIVVGASGEGLVMQGAIRDYWMAGANASQLGAPVRPAGPWSSGGVSGTLQYFDRGMVLSSVSTGTFAVLNGGFRDEWGNQGGTGGGLGWPVGDQQTVSGVRIQDFQRGTIAVSSSGATGVLNGTILDYWRSGAHATALGAPLGSRSALTAKGITGMVQSFENGMVLSSTPTGTFAVLHGAVRSEWGARGGTGGALGWPVGDQYVLADGTTRQQFQGGTVTVSSGVLTGEIGAYWSANAAKLGRTVDVASPLTAGGTTGLMQTFERGVVLSSSATGTYAVLHGPVRGVWGALGGAGGTLGWPIGDQAPRAGGGLAQVFQHGTVYVSPSGTGAALSGAVADYWNAGSNSSRLGFPVGPASPLSAGGVSGVVQMFERGMVLSSPSTGTFAVMDGKFRSAWGSLGGSGGSLGWPTGDQNPYEGGTLQFFQGGAILLLPAGGDAVVIDGPIGVYWSAGGSSSLLGPPVAPEAALVTGSASGTYRVFERGMVLTSKATGTHSVLNGRIRTAWGDQGGSSGPLGWPVSEQRSNSDGRTDQRFQGGLVVVSIGGVPITLVGEMFEYWSSGANDDALGMPTTSSRAWNAGGLTGVLQEFDRGLVLTSPTTGTHAVFNGPIRVAWGDRGGSTGILGWPVSEVETLEGGIRQRFQGGTIRVSAEGVVTVESAP